MGVQAEGVTKSYDGGKTFANRDVSIEVRPGEVYALLGPNGAGKSTFVKQMIGLLKPNSGSMCLGPHDLVADPDAARQLCSYLPQAPRTSCAQGLALRPPEPRLGSRASGGGVVGPR